MAARPILSAVSIIILAGGIVLQLFVILSGAIKGSPINLIYFLQASTSGIAGGKSNIPNPARWTYFAICGEVNGKNGNCGKVMAALPFDPKTNFGTTTGVPSGLNYYYLSRVMWAFYLIALAFAALALLLSVLAICSRLAAKITGATTLVACLVQAVTAALMTAWTVQARNTLKKNGMNATLGKYAYGFTWAAFACFLVATVLFCVGGSVDKGSSSQQSSYFGRKRSTRSRGSFRDSESGRRVKDEYE